MCSVLWLEPNEFDSTNSRAFTDYDYQNITKWHSLLIKFFFVLQGQYVLETYFIMILYGLISFGMILLLEAAENKGDIGKRRVFAVVGGVLFVFFFSLILSIFRSKAGGYPYSFLLR